MEKTCVFLKFSCMWYSYIINFPVYVPHLTSVKVCFFKTWLKTNTKTVQYSCAVIFSGMFYIFFNIKRFTCMKDFNRINFR
jgi:hypothetical protein